MGASNVIRWEWGVVEVPGRPQRQAWLDNVLPPVERVRPGLWSIPVPIPDNPLRYVLVYGLELPDGLAIVDARWATPEALQAPFARGKNPRDDIPDLEPALVTH